MSTYTMSHPVLSSLVRLPSRASAAAIGLHYLLPERPQTIRLQAIDAVCDMVCDWTAALLDQVISDPRCALPVRRHALKKLILLLWRGIHAGYQGMTVSHLNQLAAEAQDQLERGALQTQGLTSVLDDLCNHLSSAVERGAFRQLPDF